MHNGYSGVWAHKFTCMVICKGYQVWRSNQGGPICELRCGAKSRENFKNAPVCNAREVAILSRMVEEESSRLVEGVSTIDRSISLYMNHVGGAVGSIF